MVVELAVVLVVQLLVDAVVDDDEEEEDAFKTVKPRTAAAASTCFALSWTVGMVMVVDLLVVIE